MGHSSGIDNHARIAVVLGAKRIAQYSRALIAEIVFAAIVRGVPLTALEQNHTQTRSRKLLGDNAAGSTRANNNCIHALHDAVPLVRSY
jgi:hypothetical protein